MVIKVKIAVLASGSNGNATYIETKNNKFLIDDGISFKLLLSRFYACNIEINKVDSIFLTHEHFDHVCGLRMLTKNLKLDSYLSLGTYKGLNKEGKSAIDNSNVHYIKSGDILDFGNAKITVLQIHHDVYEPLGFIIEEDGKKLVYITDTGYVDKKYYEILSNADMYIVESNYDVEMLWSSNRPFELKKRIEGDHGHMSNEACAVLLSHLIGANTKTIVLAHISDDCNYYHMPELIMKHHQKVYNEFGLETEGINFVFGNRNGVTGVFEI